MYNFKILQALFLTPLLLLLALSSFGEIPRVISYQGRLTDAAGDPVTDGTYLIRFRLYDAAADGTTLWDSQYRTIQVKDGLFAYPMGDTIAIPGSVFDNHDEVWIGIKVGTDDELDPRTKISSAGFSFKSLHADSALYSTSSSFADQASQADVALSASEASNAQYLGGQIPDYYLSWENITGISIVDADVATGADIDVTKIAGTAVNLTSAQTISGNKTFTGTVYSVDSIVQLSTGGIYIGYYSDNLIGQARPLYCQARNDDLSEGNRYGGMFTAGSNSNTDGISYGSLGDARGGAGAIGAYGWASGATGSNIGGYFAEASSPTSSNDYAGYFNGDVEASGNSFVATGGIKMDHPLDPANQYLIHSDIESSEMLNLYSGNTTTNQDGEATVVLPTYFESLNTDFRYQLTVIGSFARAIVSEKIKDNKFRIKTDLPNIEVSWQVTGVRNDAYAKTNRVEVEVGKPDNERGLYLHPGAFGLDQSKQIHYKLNSEIQKDIKKIAK